MSRCRPTPFSPMAVETGNAPARLRPFTPAPHNAMTSLSAAAPLNAWRGRNDGRSAADLRPLPSTGSDGLRHRGSPIVRTGRTCSAASVTRRAYRWRKGQGKGWLVPNTACCRVPPRAPKPNLCSRANPGNPAADRRSLRAYIDMEALGENTLLIDCDVIQADAVRAPHPSQGPGSR